MPRSTRSPLGSVCPHIACDEGLVLTQACTVAAAHITPSARGRSRRITWLLVMAMALLAALAGCQAPAAGTRPGAPGGVIDKLDVQHRAVAFGGTAFGSVGPYEVLSGVVSGRLDPLHPANAGVVDLALAPRDADGWVSYQTDFTILRPRSAQAARRVIVYDVVNRGRKLAHQLYFNEGSSNALDAVGDAGNGFLMRQGITMVWSGWQGDLPLATSRNGLLGTRLPVARQHDGSAVQGVVRDEWVFDNTTNPIKAPLSYPVAQADRAQAVLRVKQRQTDAWRTHASWSYDGDRSIQIVRPADMDAGAIYELVYPARDPVVMGIGLAAIRDLVAFLRYDTADRNGTPNPLNDLRQARCEARDCALKDRQTADVVILEGISQSGRAVRDFIHQGFNVDTQGRQVFNGAMPLIAGSRRIWLNDRFAQPGRWSKEHEEHFQVGDQFPFSYPVTTDPVSGRRDGIFARCEATRSCPKLMHIDGSAEFWQGRASLVGADGRGRDIEMPAQARLYLMAATPHAYAPSGKAARPAACSLPGNGVNPGSTTRALLVALIDWVATGAEPPASQWPQVARGELADPHDLRSLGLPDLSRLGVRYQATHNFLHLTDYSTPVPTVDRSKPYRVMVPVVDGDGLDKAGVRTPDVQVPLATHLPWNPRAPGFAPGAACGGAGATLPFAADAATRQRLGDPRASIAERYPDEQRYLREVRGAIDALVAQRLMLAEDAERWMGRARAALGSR
jgi:hypothetical protein